MQYDLLLVATVEKGDSLLTRVEKTLKGADSKNLKVDRLGKKTLAYTIKKRTDANYYNLSFEAEGNTLKSLTDQLRLEQEDLLRYLLLKNVEKKVSSKKKRVAEVEEKEQKEIPKVTVAVKKASSVKSTSNKKGGTSSKTVKAKGKSK